MTCILGCYSILGCEQCNIFVQKTTKRVTSIISALLTFFCSYIVKMVSLLLNLVHKWEYWQEICISVSLYYSNFPYCAKIALHHLYIPDFLESFIYQTIAKWAIYPGIWSINGKYWPGIYCLLMYWYGRLILVSPL